MPLPTPRDDEEKDDFIQRCMGDDEMQEEFRDESQRRAVCERQWDEGQEEGQAMKYPSIIRAVYNEPWAILPSTLATILELLEMRARGEQLTPEEVRERIGAQPPRQGRQRSGAVAVLPIHGVIHPRANLMTETSGDTSAERVSAQLRDLVANPEVSSIVLDIDSPGGAVAGVPELASQVLEARSEKRIVAAANSLAASAAYWIASAASEVVVTPSGEVGSIGVIAAHDDLSGAMEKAGVRTTLISAGKYKTEGNPFEALGEGARAHIQSRVDEYYSMFVQAVARGRGVSASDVRNGFGQGRVVNAKEALRLGMVDRIATLEQTVRRLAGSSASGARAEIERMSTSLHGGFAVIRWSDGSYSSDVNDAAEAKEHEPAATSPVSDRDLRERRLRLRERGG